MMIVASLQGAYKSKCIRTVFFVMPLIWHGSIVQCKSSPNAWKTVCGGVDGDTCTFTYDNNIIIILIAGACSSKLSSSFSVQNWNYNSYSTLWIAIEQRKGGLGPLLPLVNGIPYLYIITFIPFQIGAVLCYMYLYWLCSCEPCTAVFG